MNVLEPLLYLPFVLQAAAIAVDEFYFHRRRGLPRWERIGHPLDTLSVVVTYVYLLTNHFDRLHLGCYIGLATFSCLFVTKDEFVHQEICPKREAWLHAVLFILHPLAFVAAGFLWSEGKTAPFLLGQTTLATLFFFYQLIYWSPRWVQKK